MVNKLRKGRDRAMMMLETESAKSQKLAGIGQQAHWPPTAARSPARDRTGRKPVRAQSRWCLNRQAAIS